MRCRSGTESARFTVESKAAGELIRQLAVLRSGSLRSPKRQAGLPIHATSFCFEFIPVVGWALFE